MTTTLITGANRGLGRETARRLVAEGHTVYLGARNPERGRKAADQLGARFVQLDVTSDESVKAAAEEVGSLDVLVNNAGIGAPEWQTSFDTNVFGVVRAIEAFLPLLNDSAAPVVVNVSSGVGSLGRSTDPERFESAARTWTPTSSSRPSRRCSSRDGCAATTAGCGSPRRAPSCATGCGHSWGRPSPRSTPG